MKLNNKGFAITGILYTLFILFLLLLIAILATLRTRRTMLERSTMTIETSYQGNDSDSDNQVKRINNGASPTAPVTGKYIFNISHNFFKGEVQTFDYKGEVQTFTASNPGYYKVELWGAQGGGDDGGKGGYTSGYIKLDENETLYVYVGGEGEDEEKISNKGGWNGGGHSGNYTGNYSFGGGGATDIRLVKATSEENPSDLTIWNTEESLRSRIMVAGGGGGSFINTGTTVYTSNPGVGGNLTGGTGTGSYNATDSGGGTQTSAGSAVTDKQGLFGSGVQSEIGGYGGGGGGGYWGGSTGHGKPGGGGSSYISGYTGSVAVASASSNDAKGGCANGTTNINCSKHYSGKRFENPIMIDGANYMPNTDGTEMIQGKEGNGYAKITYYGTSLKDLEYLYGYTGYAQTFEAPEEGFYKIETWGASGGEFVESEKAGRGGYSSGYIKLNTNSGKNQLYIYVGEQGKNNQTTFNLGGWNGGGASGTYTAANVYNGGGGGATDVRTILANQSDLSNWKETSSLNSRIMVAGGGGGAGNFSISGGNNGYIITGGAGGGETGGKGTSESPKYNIDKYIPTGGTQTAGGINEGLGIGISTGQFGYANQSSLSTNIYGGGGGGGYYGGAEGYGTGGSGGSGYVNTDKFKNIKMLDGNSDEIPTPIGNNLMTGNAGNGFVRIRYLGKENEIQEIDDITCTAYISKGTPLEKKDNGLYYVSNDIKFVPDICNNYKFQLVSRVNEFEYDGNVMTLVKVYSFEE